MNDAAVDYLALLHKRPLSVRDLDLDAFADGIVAHRKGKPFHANPHGGPEALTVSALSWRMGWNERALQAPPPSDHPPPRLCLEG